MVGMDEANERYQEWVVHLKAEPCEFPKLLASSWEFWDSFSFLGASTINTSTYACPVVCLSRHLCHVIFSPWLSFVALKFCCTSQRCDSLSPLRAIDYYVAMNLWSLFSGQLTQLKGQNGVLIAEMDWMIRIVIVQTIWTIWMLSVRIGPFSYKVLGIQILTSLLTYLPTIKQPLQVLSANLLTSWWSGFSFLCIVALMSFVRSLSPSRSAALQPTHFVTPRRARPRPHVESPSSFVAHRTALTQFVSSDHLCPKQFKRAFFGAFAPRFQRSDSQA